jgi:hypothetical protein
MDTDAADPRDVFGKPRMNFTFLTTHEVLDLNEWRNLHDDDTWQDFSEDVKDRRDGVYPEEWFDVVRARKDRLETLRVQAEGGGGGDSVRSGSGSTGSAGPDPPGAAVADEAERGQVAPRLRPGCVPWEAPSLGDGGADGPQGAEAPDAPRAVRRCAFSVPSEESLASLQPESEQPPQLQPQQPQHSQSDDDDEDDLNNLNDDGNSDGSVKHRHRRTRTSSGLPEQMLLNAVQAEGAQGEDGGGSNGVGSSGGALIWHPQPVTIARKVSSA